jgi:hypothetical protein
MWLHLRSALIWLALLVPFAAPAQAPTGDKTPQTANPTPEIPKFYSESRQIIVEAAVWDPPNKNGKADTSLIPQKPRERVPKDGRAVPQLPKWWPTPARGLTLKDFRVLDNGVEQKINFLKEADFPAGDIPGQWWMDPDMRGTWGRLEVFDSWTHLGRPFAPATATYLIGYVPPSLKSGECRAIQVVVERREVDANRMQYCGLRDSAGTDRTPEETNLESQMRSSLNSAARQSIKVSMQAFAFWSSGVLHLISETESAGEGPVLHATDFTYEVEVHDAKAPATVQITIEFGSPIKYWNTYDCRKKNPAIHVLGMVYKANGELASQFADSVLCLNPLVPRSTFIKEAWKRNLVADWAIIPTRFDTQVELPPGDYELRVVVSDGKHFGRAQVPLRVEGFDGRQLTISDVVLAGIARDASWVAREAASVSPAPVIPAPLVSKNVQFFPAVGMSLPRRSPLSLYFEIYEPLLENEKPAVYYRVRIANLKTGSLVMNTGPMSAADWVQPGNVVLPIGLKLATDKLRKGSYRLEVQASDSAGRESEWRQATFTIE